jgi:hypothetical protein
MHGRYSEDLGHFARTQARRIKELRRKEEEELVREGLQKYENTFGKKLKGKFTV